MRGDATRRDAMRRDAGRRDAMRCAYSPSVPLVSRPSFDSTYLPSRQPSVPPTLHGAAPSSPAPESFPLHRNRCYSRIADFSLRLATARVTSFLPVPAPVRARLFCSVVVRSLFLSLVGRIVSSRLELLGVFFFFFFLCPFFVEQRRREREGKSTGKVPSCFGRRRRRQRRERISGCVPNCDSFSGGEKGERKSWIR